MDTSFEDVFEAYWTEKNRCSPYYSLTAYHSYCDDKREFEEKMRKQGTNNGSSGW